MNPQPDRFYYRERTPVDATDIKAAERLATVIVDLGSIGTLTYEYAGYRRIVVERSRDGILAKFETCQPEEPR